MFLRRRYPNAISILLVVGGLIVSLFFMRKMKQLYEDHQKFHRLESYKQFMEEVSEGMEALERSANHSIEKLHHLNSALHRLQQPDARNANTSR